MGLRFTRDRGSRALRKNAVELELNYHETYRQSLARLSYACNFLINRSCASV